MHKSIIRDRRKYQRLTLSLSVVIRLGGPIEERAVLEGEEIEVTALDISEGGIGLVSKYLIPKGSLLAILMDFTTINIEGEIIFHKPIEAEGEVRSIIPWEEKQHRLGIKFTKINREDRISICEFVKKFMHYRPPKFRG